MSTFQNRELQWDFVKTILMFLVVYGHVSPANDNITYAETWNGITRITGLFVMPLFFIISGYFQSNIQSFNDLISKYKRTVTRILIPLISWGVVYLLVHYFMSGYLPPIYAPLSFSWFLSALLFCIISGSLVSFLLNVKETFGWLVMILLQLIVILMPFDIFHLSFVFSYYLFGMFIKLVLNKYSIGCLFICNRVSRSFSSLCFVIVLSVIIAYLGYNFYPSDSFYFTSNLLKHTDFNFIVYRFILCLIASILFLFWCFKFYENHKRNTIVQRIAVIGRDTLFIYCSHVIFLSLIYSPFLSSILGGGLQTFHALSILLVNPIMTIVLYITLQYCCDGFKHSKLLSLLFLGI